MDTPRPTPRTNWTRRVRRSAARASAGGEAPGCPAGARLVLSFGGGAPGLADEGARADKNSGGGAADADADADATADVNVRGVWLSWEEAGSAG